MESPQETVEPRAPSASVESLPGGNTLVMQAAAAAAARGEHPTPPSGRFESELDSIQCRVAEESKKGKAESFAADEALAETEGDSLLGSTPQRDWRNTRLESILREHEPFPTPGPIDLDLWVARNWLTGKERIELAPLRNHRWAVIRMGKTWEIALEIVPGK